MKKFTTMAICFVLIACMVAGGSLAYLTDRDSVANVFTVGDVRIELTEDFEQGAKLTPGVDINKDVQIKNTGVNNAYVWYQYAIPTVLDNTDASKNVIHVNHAGANWLGYQDNTKYWAEGQTEATPANQCWIVDYDVTTQKINDGDYNVYTVLYNGVLEAGKTTTIGMTKVYMDPHVDIDTDGKWYHVEKGVVEDLNWNTNTNGAPIIYVSAYAVQAEGFADVNAAYAAYNEQWDDPTTDKNEGAEWAKPATAVTSVEELTEAITNGGEIVLKDNFESNVVVDAEKEVGIDLQGNILTGTINNNGDVVISGGTIEQSGSNVLYNEGNAEITNVTANMTNNTGYITNSRNDGSVTEFNNVDFTSTGGGVNVWQGEAVFNSGVITTNSTSTSARHVFYVAEGAKLTINDGEFKFNPANLTRKGSYICAENNSEVIVNGGIFHKPSTRTAPIQAVNGSTVKIYGGTFQFDPSAFVADGYVAVEADGWWTVSAE